MRRKRRTRRELFAEKIRHWFFGLARGHRPREVNLDHLVQSVLGIPYGHVGGESRFSADVANALLEVGFVRTRLEVGIGHPWIYEATPLMLGALRWAGRKPPPPPR